MEAGGFEAGLTFIFFDPRTEDLTGEAASRLSFALADLRKAGPPVERRVAARSCIDASRRTWQLCGALNPRNLAEMSEKRKAPEGSGRAAGAGLLGDLMAATAAMPSLPKKPKPPERNMGEDPSKVRKSLQMLFVCAGAWRVFQCLHARGN